MDSFKDGIKQKWNAIADAGIIRLLIILTAVIIIFAIFGYIADKLSLRKRKCNTINKIYKNPAKLSSFDKNDSQFKYTLKDYYIKTAYNACSIGKFKNSFVDLCSLKEVIRQGYRCLDFAVYSVNNNPVVATSAVKNYDVKQTYNSIPFEEVCDTIENYAFSGSSCPNPNDPLFIHLRLLSENNVICNKIANAIYSKLNRRVLGKKYSYENNGRNLGDIPIVNLQKKVIIMVDKVNPMFQGTELEEYVNLASNSVFMQAMRYERLRNTPDMQEQKEFNKTRITLVMPDINDSDDNPNSALAFEYGCQMIAMSAQNYDGNLLFYDKKFNNAGTAFILKPENLRYKPVTITVPSDPNPNHAFTERMCPHPVLPNTKIPC